jgi:hypothetical protein
LMFPSIRVARISGRAGSGVSSASTRDLEERRSRNMIGTAMNSFALRTRSLGFAQNKEFGF